MRLIDADANREDFMERVYDILLDEPDNIKANLIIDAFDEMPTAYNPDKVVEQLEKLKKAEQNRPDDCDEDGYGDGEQIYDDGRSQGRFEAFGKAIEIVRSEYVTEQSCEWELEDAESNLYVTGCENRQLIFEGTPEENGYKYCPYCGRKMKRGGADG